MQLLETKFTYTDFEYEQIDRTDNVAIYSQRLVEVDKIVAYEVFEITRQEAGERMSFGNKIVYEAKEMYPSNEAFGVTAWSFMAKDKEHALLFFSELDKEVIERNKNKTLKDEKI